MKPIRIDLELGDILAYEGTAYFVDLVAEDWIYCNGGGIEWNRRWVESMIETGQMVVTRNEN